MKSNKIANIVIGLLVLVATAAAFIYVNQQKEQDVLIDTRVEKLK